MTENDKKGLTFFVIFLIVSKNYSSLKVCLITFDINKAILGSVNGYLCAVILI